MAADEKRPQRSLRSWTGSTIITSSSDKLAQRLGRISEPATATATATATASQDLSLQDRNFVSPVSSISSRGDSEHTPCIDGEDQAGRADGILVYRSYKRRWFGLAQLTLMNVMVSWAWMTYAPVASSAASYYGVTTAAINWISTAFFLAFVSVFPLAATLLHRSLRGSFICSAVLLLAGNWLRYAGSASRSGGNFACAMAGTILVGFAQPLVLAAPAKYSDLWFTDRGRVTATALASLANPFGAALGQLVNPFWVSEPGHVSPMVLYVAIISTVCCVPSFFVPSGPPTPVGPSSETPKLPLRQSLRAAVRSPELWLVFAAFSVFVGLFNAISTLLNQIMVPYGFSDDQAGIGGAILIVVGLLFAAVSSPVLDRTKAFLPAIKILVPLVALCYLAFVWMPATRAVAGPYVVLALLGAGSFALVPIAVEFLTDLSHPISPALTSTTAWAGGQLFGAIFVIASNSFVAGPEADPPNNMNNFLVFQAVLAIAATPTVLVLGLFGREDKVALKRLQHQEQQQHQPTTTV